MADRHLAVYAALAIESEEPMRGPAMVDWLDRLDAELDNLGAALEWGLEAEPWTAVRMATALLPYWAVRVMSQDNDDRIVAAIEIARARVLGRPDAEPADQALAATAAGRGGAPVGHVGTCAASRSAGPRTPCASPTRAATPRPVWPRMAGLGDRDRLLGPGGSGRHATCGRSSRSGADLAEEIGQWWLLALAAGFAGASLGSFDPDGGAALMQRGVDGGRRSGSPYAIGAVSMAQGRMLGRQGKTDAAVAAFGVAIERFMELGDERFVLASRSDMAHALRRGGRLDEALALYRETIGGWVHLGHKGAVANQLENVAYLAYGARADRARGPPAGRRGCAPRGGRCPHGLRRGTRVHRVPGSAARRADDRRRSRTPGPPVAALSQADAVALASPTDRPTMPSQLLDTLPVPLVFVAFAIVTMVCYEVGFRLGRWWQERTPGEQEGPTGMLVGSILALLAFLLAVTMGMAADRFDARRALVLAEANAIGTAYLRAGYLPEPASSQARELLRQYVPLRIVVTDADDLQADIDQSNAILAQAVDGDRGRRQRRTAPTSSRSTSNRSTRRSISTRAGSRRASTRASRRRSCSCSSAVPR